MGHLGSDCIASDAVVDEDSDIFVARSDQPFRRYNHVRMVCGTFSKETIIVYEDSCTLFPSSNVSTATFDLFLQAFKTDNSFGKCGARSLV